MYPTRFIEANYLEFKISILSAFPSHCRIWPLQIVLRVIELTNDHSVQSSFLNQYNGF